MNRYVFSVLAALALAGCGKSESAKEESAPDNAEVPAEQALRGIDATPVADPSAAADAAGAVAAPEDASPTPTGGR